VANYGISKMVMGSKWGTARTSGEVTVTRQPRERGSVGVERVPHEVSFEQNAWETLVCNGFLEVYLPHFKCWREA
jgi:hypothetical protein